MMRHPGDAPGGSQPLPGAYYEQVEVGRFRSTIATQSPWDFAAQHGGPASALLVRAIERHVDDPSLRIARISSDFLGQIPQGVADVTTRTIRPGRRVCLVESALSFAGRDAVVVRSWLIHREDSRIAPVSWVAPAPPLPGPQEQRYFPRMAPSWGYGRSVEWRFVTGGFHEAGPGAVWARPHTAVVAGEMPSPIQSLMVVADSTNGISAPTHAPGWLFIPPGITVTLLREPVGEWIFFDAATSLSADGIGVAHAAVSDPDGFVAYVDQPVLVAPAAG